MRFLKKELAFVLTGAGLIAALTAAILHAQHPSLAFSYRDGVDAIGMLNYIHQAGFSFSVPFVNLETLGEFGPQDPWLSPSQWLAAAFGTGQSVLDACYVLCAAELFLSTYLLARWLGSPKDTAALAGLVLALFALPLVWSGGPFSTLLTLTPAFGDFIVLNNLLLTGLAGIFRPEGSARGGYALFATGLLWLILAVPLAAILAIPFDAAFYAILSLHAAGTPRFWTRQGQLLALFAAMLLLLGPYMFGLFANTSSSLFKSELVGDTFTNPWPYLPAPFRTFNNAVATTALGLLFYAAHRWHGRSMEEFPASLVRILALFGAVSILLSMLFVLAAKGSGTFPRPFYFEVAAWPFYALCIGFIASGLWRWICSAPSLAARPALHGYILLALFRRCCRPNDGHHATALRNLHHALPAVGRPDCAVSPGQAWSALRTLCGPGGEFCRWRQQYRRCPRV